MEGNLKDPDLVASILIGFYHPRINTYLQTGADPSDPYDTENLYIFKEKMEWPPEMIAELLSYFSLDEFQDLINKYPEILSPKVLRILSGIKRQKLIQLYPDLRLTDQDVQRLIFGDYYLQVNLSNGQVCSTLANNLSMVQGFEDMFESLYEDFKFPVVAKSYIVHDDQVRVLTPQPDPSAKPIDQIRVRGIFLAKHVPPSISLEVAGYLNDHHVRGITHMRAVNQGLDQDQYNAGIYYALSTQNLVPVIIS